MTEPRTKRVIFFFDGQNLYYAAKQAFQYNYPNYEPKALAQKVCALFPDWKLKDIYFYTGIPSPQDSDRWHYFWSSKLGAMGTKGIKIYSRQIRFGKEKGIDVRMALDMVRLSSEKELDVAVVFSQDQDLSEAVKDVKKIASKQKRWIKIASAFPVSPFLKNARGINGTDWIRIDKATYDQCIDAKNYQPPKPNSLFP